MGLLTAAYNALSTTDKALSVYASVGKDLYSSSDSNFCQGLSAGHSTAWWSAWGVAQRDVVVMYKHCTAGWKVYCRFSLNTYNQAEFSTVTGNALTYAKTCTGSNSSTTSNSTTPSPTPSVVVTNMGGFQARLSMWCLVTLPTMAICMLAGFLDA